MNREKGNIPAPIPRRRAVGVLLVAMLTVGAALGLPHAWASESAPETDFPRSRVSIETAMGRFDFDVEVADTRARRIQGLQHRRALAADAGMLFDYGESREIAMWMKNTHLPLDMLFIDARGRVARVVSNTVPLSLTPIPSGEPVRAVLELNAGTARQLHIRQGDRVHHPMFDAAAK